MKYKIFDTHAHYDSDSFDEDRENVIKELKENGVIGVLNCGSDLYGLRKSVELAKEFDMFYAAVGIHPENADEFNEDVVKEIKEFVKNEKVKAIGEIGLDYYWEENPPREVQKEVFRAQMKLADELNLPVVIHDRDAHKDTLEIMKEFPHVIGVVHCFSGSVEFAKECIKLGYYIGFTGVLTFKNAKKLVDVCREIPAERMLVETDCPFMAPVPFRGKRNKSDYIEYIIDKMSEIRGISGEEMNEILLNNKKRLFKI
ncbi:TatD family hydrolase [Clostridium perfringens]|uniref:YchF/TatD family DNA exonuclease n=1 Tax=Clostridium perfringens TaxID=1502 RepID=A0AAW9KH04_CLOPF|nr:TatD family hydrolase [Clostridium perfringens]MBI5993163.1 TatD family hydrolase [Clostridium perfringens]MBI6073072.1 TatD family hydrolase [Clostridium perfringens]MBI6075555.1 TatD family hydrolase [Clostridium perfringens]MBI6086914.1 TatD family hydrolase [Clostridium perfringens]MBI6092270.1 TatD family hydrolase [Clostridium perfringens]